MLITWTWLIAALALCVLAGLLLIGLRRSRSAREVTPERAQAPAPGMATPAATPTTRPRPEPSAAALRANAAAQQLQRTRQQARERAEQARQARAASEAGEAAQAEAAALASALAQARVDLELDLPAWPEATSPDPAPGPMPTPTPVPEVCARTAKVAGLVQAARQVRDPAPRAVDAGPQLPPLVLVVDDARTVRVKIGRVLQAQGLRLAFAVDGGDALRQLAGQCPDLLITDMDMPGLDGLGLTRALRKLPATAELPVIMVSAADDRLRAEAAAAGVTALLGKPFGDAHLVELVQSLLADPLARAADGQLRVTEPA